MGGAGREGQSRVGPVIVWRRSLLAALLLVGASKSGGEIHAQTLDTPLRSLDAFVAGERAAEGFGVLERKPDAWQHSMVWMVSSASDSTGVSVQATPFELSARRGAEQWSISGPGGLRVSAAGQSRIGLGDMTVAYDRLVPVSAATVAAGRVGVLVPSGSRVSGERPQLVAAALMRIAVAEAITAVPLVLVGVELREAPAGLARHGAELRFKLEGAVGPGTVVQAGVRSAHRRGADSTSTAEVGLRRSLAGRAQLLVEGRRALSAGQRTNAVDAGFLWSF